MSHGLSCSAACRIFLEQGWNPHRCTGDGLSSITPPGKPCGYMWIGKLIFYSPHPSIHWTNFFMPFPNSLWGKFFRNKLCVTVMVSPHLFTKTLILGFLRWDSLEADPRQGFYYQNLICEGSRKHVGWGGEMGPEGKKPFKDALLSELPLWAMGMLALRTVRSLYKARLSYAHWGTYLPVLTCQ